LKFVPRKDVRADGFALACSVCLGRSLGYERAVTNPSNSCPLKERLLKAWDASELVSLTLSVPAAPESNVRKIKVRPVLLKKGWCFSIVQRRDAQEITHNLPPREAVEWIGKEFTSRWREAHLFTLGADFKFRRDERGEVRVRKSRPAFAQAPNFSHDKERPLRNAYGEELFLRRLGVTNDAGQPRPGMAGKLRQILRFVELLGHLVDSWPQNPAGPLRVADMGAGKGYLTFAMARAFAARGLDARIIGLEARAELVDSGNALAAELGFTNLSFVQGLIGDWVPADGLDVLVALHACDTATDDALFHGIKAGARLILTSPCCHKEVRAQLAAPDYLRGVLKHGILSERQAEIITDGIRALALESWDYEARVFEFVDAEHSGKNLMLSATRGTRGGPAQRKSADELKRVMREFGIARQRLVELLQESAE
jgi:SAM-dependent methyltransferase